MLGAGAVTIEVRASLAKYQRDMRDLERISQRGAQSAERHFLRAERSVRGFNTELGLASRLLAAIGGFAAARGIVALADQYTALGARMRLVVKDGEDFASVQNDIYQMAQRLRAPLNELSNLYIRIRQATGAAHAEAARMAEVFSQTLLISGASAQESVSFLTQVSQALGEGQLRAEELNTVLSTNPRYVQLLADHLGVATTEIRKLSREGKITTEVMREAAMRGAGALADEVASIPLTVAGAMTQLRNAAQVYVGETDGSLGASRRLAQGISALAQNFESLADAMLIVSVAAVGNFSGRAFAGGLKRLSDEVDRMAALAAAPSAAAQKVAGAQASRAQMLEGQVRRRLAVVRSMQAEIAELDKNIPAMEARVSAARQALARSSGGSDPEAIRKALREGGRVGLSPNAGQPGGASGAMIRGQLEALTKAEKELADAQARRAGIASGALVRAERNYETAKRGLADAIAKGAAAQGLAARSATVWGKALDATRAVGGRLLGGLRSLVSFLGGPWGVVFTVAAIAMMNFRSEAEKAAARSSSLQQAFGVIASAKPAFEGAADAIGETADQTRTMADLTDQAASATDRLAEAQRRATGIARDQADATRALAEMRRRDAVASVQQALAEERQHLRRLRRTTLTQRVNDYALQFAGAGELVPGQSPTQIAESEEFIGILERGLAALNSGLLDANQARTPDAPWVSRPSAAEREDVRRNLAAELRLLEQQWEIDVLRAREQDALADAKQDQLDIERHILELQERYGLSVENATRRATEYVNAMRQAARAAQDRARAEAQLDQALQIAQAEGHYRRSEDLRRQAEVLRGTSHYRQLGYDGDTANAMAQRDADQLRAATARGELRMAFEQALFAAATGGDWKEALANSLRQAAEAGFARAIDFIYDMLFDAVRAAFSQNSAGSGSGFLGQVVGSLLGMSSAGGSGGSSGGGSSRPVTRANGGTVEPWKVYKGAELGAEPLFITNQPGKVITNRAMRDAMSSNTGGAARVELEVSAKTDGSVLMEIQAAEQRATVNGARLGATMVAKATGAQKSK